jgi:hypothetical protein
MKDLAQRFWVTVPQTRPRGARLLEGDSPKLKRRVRLFNYYSFAVWIPLETDPKAISFGERTASTGAPSSVALINFWIISRIVATDFPITLHDLTVCCVQNVEPAAESVWIADWRCMQSVINASHSLLDPVLKKLVRAFVMQPIAIGRLVAQFAFGDSVRVRASISGLLCKGQPVASVLRAQPLSLCTPIKAVS